jgi:tRNA dimethylallyltransferase
LVFIVGPTASGKTDVAVEIAETRSIEILNCDSVQFFDGVEIGAAKPSRDQLARVRHHLVGHVAKGADYTAGSFRRDAIKVIEEASARGIRDLLAVGGSGFYVQALEKGMFDVPEVKPHVREQLEREAEESGLAPLHAELERRDPSAAVKINPADRYRILRALEILRSAPEGSTLTSIREKFERSAPPSPFRVSKIGIFRERRVLRERVTERTRAMIKCGLIEEVEALRAEGFKNWAPLQSVGYKEVQDYLDGSLKRDELEPKIITSTMQLAKRQMTWFKRDASINWFDSEKDAQAAVSYARSLVES